MSQQPLSTQAAIAGPRLATLVNRAFYLRLAIGTAAVLLIIGLALGTGGLTVVAHNAVTGGLHGPRLSLLAEASPAIQVHVAAVVAALGVGTILLAGVKGTTVHRVLGWGWVIAMAAACVASLFIRDLNRGGPSLLHLFTAWVLVLLPIAVVAARRHNVRRHGRMMTGLFLGGLVIAGATAFVPGRLMWQVFFG